MNNWKLYRKLVKRMGTVERACYGLKHIYQTNQTVQKRKE